MDLIKEVILSLENHIARSNIAKITYKDDNTIKWEQNKFSTKVYSADSTIISALFSFVCSKSDAKKMEEQVSAIPKLDDDIELVTSSIMDKLKVIITINNISSAQYVLDIFRQCEKNIINIINATDTTQNLKMIISDSISVKEESMEENKAKTEEDISKMTFESEYRSGHQIDTFYSDLEKAYEYREAQYQKRNKSLDAYAQVLKLKELEVTTKAKLVMEREDALSIEYKKIETEKRNIEERKKILDEEAATIPTINNMYASLSKETLASFDTSSKELDRMKQLLGEAKASLEQEKARNSVLENNIEENNLMIEQLNSKIEDYKTDCENSKDDQARIADVKARNDVLFHEKENALHEAQKAYEQIKAKGEEIENLKAQIENLTEDLDRANTCISEMQTSAEMSSDSKQLASLAQQELSTIGISLDIINEGKGPMLSGGMDKIAIRVYPIYKMYALEIEVYNTRKYIKTCEDKTESDPFGTYYISPKSSAVCVRKVYKNLANELQSTLKELGSIQ